MFDVISQPDKMRMTSFIVLAICNVMFMFLLPLSFIAVIGPHGPLIEGIQLIIGFSFLVITPLTMIGSWVLYRQRSYAKSIRLSLAPLISVVLFIIIGLLS